MSKTAPKKSILNLYEDIRQAKTKAEGIAALRKYIAWNDIPKDVWDKLEKWSGNRD